MQNDMRDRLVKILGDKSCPKQIPCDICEYQDFYNCHHYAVADHLIANGVILPPLTVGYMVDKWFSHNETVAIWHDKKGENCHYLLWKGMGWDIPNKFKELSFIKFFGTIPESIMDADTINIEVAPYIKPAYEQKLKELSENG